MTIQRRVNNRGLLLARGADRRYFRSLSACSLRLAAQDVALSRRKQGFESPRERACSCLKPRDSTLSKAHDRRASGTCFTSPEGENHEQREYEISLGPKPRSAFSLTNPPFNDQRRSVPSSSPRVPSIELTNLSRSKRLLKPPYGTRRNLKPAIPTLQPTGPPIREMLSHTSPRRSAIGLRSISGAT